LVICCDRLVGSVAFTGGREGGERGEEVRDEIWIGTDVASYVNLHINFGQNWDSFLQTLKYHNCWTSG